MFVTIQNIITVIRKLIITVIKQISNIIVIVIAYNTAVTVPKQNLLDMKYLFDKINDFSETL